MEGVMGNMLKNQVEGKLKDSTKDVKFKSLYTWARISGFLCSAIVVGMAFNQFSTPGCASLAIVGGCLTFFCEVVCCFKCCSGTKACATKVDQVLSYGPFFKGTLYIVIGVCGFIAYHYEIGNYFVVAVAFDFILMLLPGVLYILAFIINDKCKIRKKDQKNSDIEEQMQDYKAAPSAPHEYAKKNFFSKACKVCGEANAEACAEAQAAAAAAAAEAAKNSGGTAVVDKMRAGFTNLGARMSNGFKELGAKMKIGSKNSSPANRGAQSEDAESNPFSRGSSRPASKPKATVTADVERNPFL